MFILSKILWAMVSPSALMFLGMVAALLWQRRRPGLTRALLALSTLFLGALLLCPIGAWTVRSLERRFPLPDPPRVDGIIVLGGAIQTDESVLPGWPSLNDAAERITALSVLARRYPDAKLIYSGGSGLALDQRDREADQARLLLQAMGIDGGRVIYEDASRNTWENAVDSKKLADPKPGETWLLVTSAWHMPRAVGCFRKAGWPVLAYPVDYLGNNTRWAGFDAPRQLYTISIAEKEWLGLLAYHLMGRTDALFPAPPTTH